LVVKKIKFFVLQKNYSISFLSQIKFEYLLGRNEGDSVVVGIAGNVYNWLSYGIVGNSVCRTWESCSL